MMIGTVVKSTSNMVMVFDRHGEQLPHYQGEYNQVSHVILRDAPPDTVFVHLGDFCPGFFTINRNKW